MAAEMETEEFADKLATLAGDSDSCGIAKQLKDVMQQLERQTMELLKDARRVTRDRDALLNALYIMQYHDHVGSLSPGDRETVAASCESLMSRCHSVQVNIDPEREPDQELALQTVNNWINKLILSIRQNPDEARTKCAIYVETLSGDGQHDSSFFSLVSSCSDTDREEVGDRLAGLLKYIDYVIGKPSELE